MTENVTNLLAEWKVHLPADVPSSKAFLSATGRRIMPIRGANAGKFFASVRI